MQFQINEAVEILSNTPETVKSLLGNLSEDWVRSEENAENWSPFDIVGHLIHAEETDWIPRAEIILAQGENPRFEPFDRLGHFEKSKDKTLDELLESFAAARRESLEKLAAFELTPERLRLKGIHPEFGEVTLAQLVSTWVVHDLTHIRQIVVALAKKYQENVGPWQAYLSILK